MPTDVYDSSTTWLCPVGVTSVDVECWGGGGAAGFPTTKGTTGAGGGGAYSKKLSIATTPGNNYTVTVGAGGDGDTATDRKSVV